MGKMSRKLFSTNKFERKVLTIIMVSVSIPIFIVIAFFYMLFYDVIYGYLQSGLADHFIHRFLNMAIIILCSFFFGVGMLSYRLVHRLLGSFPRISRELDDIISGKHKNKICLRDDDFGKELIDRVNVLIDKLP